MSLTQDWMMRQIETYVELICRVLFRKERAEYVILDEAQLTEEDKLYCKLKTLVEEQRFDEAENYLYECYEPTSEAHMRLALDFYGRLNTLEDAVLEAHDFSREEVEEGLHELMRRSGVGLEGLNDR